MTRRLVVVLACVPAFALVAGCGGGGGENGKEVFQDNCGSCHTLADAGTAGTIGPSLDAAKPPSDLVVDRVTNGSGIMPSFGDALSEEQIQAVAKYVSSAVGS